LTKPALTGDDQIDPLAHEGLGGRTRGVLVNLVPVVEVDGPTFLVT